MTSDFITIRAKWELLFTGSIFLIRIIAQKMKFSIKDFFSKCDQIRRKLQIWSHLLKKSLMENFIFRAVNGQYTQYKYKSRDKSLGG